MRAGLVTSVALHAVLIGYGVFSISAPRSYDVADVESLPVDIIPVESVTQIQQGDREAELAEQSAPRPTQRPEPVEDATKVGEADTDLEAPPTPSPESRSVERAVESSSEPAPEPSPRDVTNEGDQQAEGEETRVAATERDAETKPPQEVQQDPASESLVAESPQDESVALPQSAPLPQSRPQPPKPQTAKAPEHRKTETAEQKQAESSKDEELFDQVAALLNKEEASGGGAKRSSEQAALGGNQTTPGQTLTQSEMDALRGQIQRCWNVPAGAIDAENLRVSVKFSLDASGAVEGNPQIIDGGGSSTAARAAADSARRAVLRCAPYNLPVEKYSAWSDVIVHFDPSDMF